ncbi:unnamed protein product [Dicrocoelium dendriticum]|nr:unnamed protein product [Dicrocoelium dendriticum]
MESFVSAFFRIDTDGDDVITTDDLRYYVEKNNLDHEMITKWSELFDKDRSGRITLTEFCDTLGLKATEVRAKRMDMISNAGGLREGIRVISTTMTLEDQIAISEETWKLVHDPSVKRNELADRIKQYLDQTYKPAWQVVITTGSYWASYAHLPGSSFIYQLDDLFYLIWKTGN